MGKCVVEGASCWVMEWLGYVCVPQGGGVEVEGVCV